MTSPLASIIVPTHNRPQHLAECLDSIASTVNLPHEVICVPVADDEATLALLEARPEANLRIVEQEERQGFVQAANLGFRSARGEWALQLNDDCILMPHAIANAIRFMTAPAHDGRIGQAAFFHSTPMARNVHQQIDVEGVRYVVAHVRGLCFANFGLVRRSLGEQLGWYDERYTMYGADPDFSLKVWHEAKLEVAPCPGALVRHALLEDERAKHDRHHQHDADNRLLFEKWKLD